MYTYMFNLIILFFFIFIFSAVNIVLLDTYFDHAPKVYIFQSTYWTKGNSSVVTFCFVVIYMSFIITSDIFLNLRLLGWSFHVWILVFVIYLSNHHHNTSFPLNYVNMYINKYKYIHNRDTHNA
jgi:hypothetical protein